MAELKYAVYPGTVSTYDENGNPTGDVTWNAADLAAAYGVQDEPYLTVNSPLDVPKGLAYFEYLHLVPRADNKYENIMYTAEDDGEDVAYRPEFDPTKQYFHKTDPPYKDPDLELDFRNRHP